MVAATGIGMNRPPDTSAFFPEALRLLDQASVPFLVGGAYTLYCYTGIQRHTKDLDLFVRRDDCRAVLDAFAAAGCRAELVFPHWLGKASQGDEFVDIIFSSGNGFAPVDDQWFEHAVAAEVFGHPVRLVPPEEMIWQKAYIQERERFDGADIMHLILARGHDLDWTRLLARFGPHWRVLLGHLIAFGFVYPSERARVPAWVMDDLVLRLQAEVAAVGSGERVCQGTLLSREQYLVDIERWGEIDARLQPLGPMTPAEVARWTRAIVDEPSPPVGHVAELDSVR